jgi:tRNA dimethylallyltransferase
MQVYSVLSVVTARPTDEDMRRVPHRLYGHVPPGQPYSTGEWLRDVGALIESGAFKDRKAVFVGGTGLYFRALTEGLSPMPAIAPALREHWRRRLAEEGAERLHAELAARDEASARALEPSDGQRIVRALEVLEASGRPIRDWRSERSRPLVEAASAKLIVLQPERDVVISRIERRFERMVEEGALDEVRALLALGIDPSMPALKAIGVPELAAVLGGTSDLDTAIAQARAATRRYAKRQVTWLRHQMGEEWRRLPATPDDSAASLYERFRSSKACQ